ncbi:DUF2812 domain-containing protein [Alkalibacter rhizosphaerae]|uniref:DUF2812 domain-containing protein n=1 Tax=Alkalibacter rhizosphaerae TaxID=2815577 RepID=A0A974XDW1_9FIRM|nr:DUF2812 domain-containing protein [Alkalibacter rhizosphaerae]QSX08052.1 DUF2812 domain-containing protein [Alkalibacter rhizosphaerae]
MKKKIVLHPGIYAIEENQALYRRMASKGWSLTKRGSLLSYFDREEPEERYYRMILTKPTSWKEPEADPPSHQESGWELVSESGGTWVYSTTGESNARSDQGPRQELKALKSARSKQIWNVLGLAFSLVLESALTGLLPFPTRGSGLQWWADAQRFLVQSTAFSLLILVFFGFFILQSIYGYFRLTRQIRRMKSEDPLGLEEEEKGRISLGRMLFVFAMVVFAGLSLYQLAVGEEYDMPAHKEEGYMILEDLGHKKRKAFDPNEPFYNDDEFGMVWKNQSLLAKWMETTEYSDDAWLFQTKFDLHEMVDPDRFAQVLMRTAVFDPDPADWRPHDVSGVDHAYSGKTGLEFLLVKGQRVLFVKYSGRGDSMDRPASQKEFLEQVASIDFDDNEK